MQQMRMSGSSNREEMSSLRSYIAKMKITGVTGREEGMGGGGEGFMPRVPLLLQSFNHNTSFLSDLSCFTLLSCTLTMLEICSTAYIVHVLLIAKLIDKYD